MKRFFRGVESKKKKKRIQKKSKIDHIFLIRKPYKMVLVWMKRWECQLFIHTKIMFQGFLYKKLWRFKYCKIPKKKIDEEIFWPESEKKIQKK